MNYDENNTWKIERLRSKILDLWLAEQWAIEKASKNPKNVTYKKYKHAFTSIRWFILGDFYWWRCFKNFLLCQGQFSNSMKFLANQK